MIKSLCCCFSTVDHSSNSLRKSKKNESNCIVNAIAKINFKLIGCIAGVAACAYLHDYNIVLAYGFVGVIFYKQIPEITHTIGAIVRTPFVVLNDLVFNPLNNIKFKNWRVLHVPNRFAQIITAVGAFLTVVYFVPISFIAIELICAINFGAGLAKRCLEIVNYYDERAKEAKETNSASEDIEFE